MVPILVAGLVSWFETCYKFNILILTRKSGETITIGEDIEVKVLSIKGGQVRIGIDAPREVGVNREEVVIDLASGTEAQEENSKP